MNGKARAAQSSGFVIFTSKPPGCGVGWPFA
jgi:hypothetical protein